MTARAHDKITAGLADALAFAGGDASKGRMTATRLTPAQRRALLWLLPGGKDTWWHGKDGRAGTPRTRVAIRSLVKAGFAIEPFSDVLDSRFALTPAGQAMRAQIEKDGAGS